MKPVIYIDVLIFLNTIITFLLLLAAGRLMKLSPSPGRLLLGSFLGGASSLIILAPDMGILMSLLTKLLFCLAIVTAVFNPKSVKAVIRQTGYFFAVNFIFAGLMLFICSLPNVSLIQYNNGAVYINFSVTSLTVSSLLCYLITVILGKITNKKTPSDSVFDIEIHSQGKSVKGKALLDTGNSLEDPFSGEGVIIIRQSFGKDILPENIVKYLEGNASQCEKIRLIPFSTVSSEGLMPCFRAEKVIVSGSKDVYFLKNTEIGVSNKKNMPNALINPQLLSNPERRKDHAEAAG